MKAEWRVLGGVGAFVVPFALLYWVASYEHAGSALMAAFVMALLFLAVYLLTQARRSAPRPEDRDDATPEEGAGDIGFFPSASVWPLTLGIGATMVAYGLVFSVWLALPGLAVLLFAAVGYAAEAQRHPEGS